MALSQVDRAVFADMYRFYEKFAARTMDAQAFCEAADEWALLVHKHNGSLLAQDMFAAIYEHLSNRYTHEREGGSNG